MTALTWAHSSGSGSPSGPSTGLAQRPTAPTSTPVDSLAAFRSSFAASSSDTGTPKKLVGLQSNSTKSRPSSLAFWKLSGLGGMMMPNFIKFPP